MLDSNLLSWNIEPGSSFVEIFYDKTKVLRIYLGEAIEIAGREPVTKILKEIEKSPWIPTWHSKSEVTMLTPNDAFLRLKKSGNFVEIINNVHIQWYWHEVGNGFKHMASRYLGSNSPPTLYREFHVTDRPITRKRSV